jgi:hypothetical protein
MKPSEKARIRWGRKATHETNRKMMEQLADPKPRARLVRAYGKAEVKTLEKQCRSMQEDLDR